MVFPKNSRFLFVTMLFSSFVFLNQVFSASSDIVINEIAAYPTSTHEWVEIWNRGLNPVDLKGWKFLEGGVRHGLTTSSTDSIMASGEYGVITQNGNQFRLDHPEYTSSIFDSSWSGLNEGGELIGIEDAVGVVVEQFSYGATKNFSLERVDPFLSMYGSENWKEHLGGNTLGFINSVAIVSSSGVPSSTPPSSSTTPSATTTLDGSLGWSGLRVNEVMPNPLSGDEWVELFNTGTSTVLLSGGFLCDGRAAGNCTIASLDGFIAPQSWIIVSIQGSKLNNTGDSVFLKNASSTIFDSMSYVNDLVPKSGEVVARSSDGFGVWVLSSVATPSSTNIIKQPVSSAGAAPTTVYASAKDMLRYSGATPVVINEIFPNPKGNDLDGEFIELKNISTSPTLLDWWSIEDGVQTYRLSGELDGGDLLFLSRKTTNINLKNSGEQTLRLININSEVAHEVRLSSSTEDKSYSRAEDGGWIWTKEVTPGAENVFATNTIFDNISSPEMSSSKRKEVFSTDYFVWNIPTPRYVHVGENITLSTVGSFDMRGGVAEFAWKIGDNQVVRGEQISLVFTTSGLHNVVVSVSTTAGTVASKNFQIPVGIDGVGGGNDVIISEVYPYPDTKIRTDFEFVELFNKGSETALVGEWRMVVDETKTFVIPPDTKILPGSFLVFFKPVTKLVLGNKESRIELFTKADEKIDEVLVGQAKLGKSYSMIGENWYWDKPSPYKVMFFPSTPNKTEEIKSKKITSPASNQKNGTQKTTQPHVIKFADISKIDKGRMIKLEGIVTALPGTFSSQSFYVGSENDGGVQIYQNKKDFPELMLGDRVEVTGKISESLGMKRINIAAKKFVDILDTDQFFNIKKVSVSQALDLKTGSLVQIEGEITQLKSSFFYLDDGKELRVDLKQSAHISKNDYMVGDKVLVTGILEKNTKETHLLPRSNEDVEIVAHVSETSGSLEEGSTSTMMKKIIVLGASGVVLVVVTKFGLFLKQRKNDIKK
jgi:uncharacterized protein YdeI (BOF family)